jgi:acetyl esterase/lipase
LVAAISLAGIADLQDAWRLGLGEGVVGRLIGGSPDQYPERYAESSPINLLPMGLQQILIHGRNDDRVPISQSQRFTETAKAAGDEPSLIELDGTGHFELIDPESQAWSAVAQSTLAALGVEER